MVEAVEQTLSRPSLKHWTQELQCPACRARLENESASLRCVNDLCAKRFPILNGIPIIIDESSSVFRIGEIIDGNSFFPKRPSWMEGLKTIFPKSIYQPQTKTNFRTLGKLLRDRENPRILVIGTGMNSEAMKRLMNAGVAEFVETDVGFNGSTALVCDAHGLPFPDDYFDAIVMQAVLEHVIDPYRCVSEAHRVLKVHGFVYAETPFMQQVHGGRYDFLRFTDLGHRRLFRAFTEVASGALGGPAAALAWAYEYFLISFSRGQKTKLLLKAFARFTAFWLKYLDHILLASPGALDAASAYYFLGQKSTELLPDRQLLQLYRGLC